MCRAKRSSSAANLTYDSSPLCLSLMSDPIVALLAKQPLPRLNDMLREASEQIADLRQQTVWIERAIKEREGGSLSMLPASRETSEPRQGGRRRSAKREAILDVLGSREPGRAWTPSEVRAALNERGISSSTENVRVTLRRMLDAGDVERGGADGLGWKLPSDGSAADQAPPDESRSANGYAPEGALPLGTG